jgi:DMSO/TMAO reductase YedYZ molybdopterin-dependent catalytic subunit
LKGEKMKKLIALIIVMLMVCAIFIGCKASSTATETTAAATTAAETTAQTSETALEAAWTIMISGIGDKGISFTDADAAKMSTVDITAALKDVDHKWIGILLKAILDSYGAKDYTKIKMEALDGYSAELDKTAVDDAGTILALKEDGQAISKDNGFIQIVAKNQPTKSWVKAVTKITVLK